VALVYLDSSALVKLVSKEPESSALVEFVKEVPEGVSSGLARVEVLRAVGRAGGKAAMRRQAEQVLNSIGLVKIDDRVLNRAADLEPTELRSLDAIHLATALSLGADLDAFVSYDQRQRQAAEGLGLRVVSPI
jgi:predicted nucleic acid-binding protein